MTRTTADRPRRRVLLVEDDVAVRMIVRRILGPAYEVVDAPDGETALQYAREESPFDLLLYDPGLPGDDAHRGSRLLWRLYALLGPGEIRVVVISGGDMTEILESGLFASLPKPITPDPLRHLCAQLLKAPEVSVAAEVVTREPLPAPRPAWVTLLGVLLFVAAMLALWLSDAPLGVVVSTAAFGFTLSLVGPSAGESFTRIADRIGALFGGRK